MNKRTVKKAVAVLAFLCVPLLTANAAFAHRVNVFAWVEGDTIFGESKFPGGKRVKAGKFVVLDADGKQVYSGVTDDRGEFSFQIPRRADLKIVLKAGQGHQAEWTVRADEMEDLPIDNSPPSGTGVTPQPRLQKAAAPPPANMASPARQADIRPEQLEAIIETALDKKLKPLTRMLADMRQEGPTARDIIAGIGYIFGLVGIAAYIHSRKRKAV